MVPEAVREPDAAMSIEVSQPVHTTYNPRGRLNQTAEFNYHHGPEPTVVNDGIINLERRSANQLVSVNNAN